MSLIVRDAAPADAALILRFIEDLADYEKLRHEAEATLADIERELFGPAPKVFCQIAEWKGEPAGFALWFYTFSTFVGRHGIWLEDLFVRSDMRGHGVGKMRAHLLPVANGQTHLREDASRILDDGRGALAFDHAIQDHHDNAFAACIAFAAARAVRIARDLHDRME